MLDRPEIDWSRPRIVHRHERALLARGLGDGGHVLHLEGERAGRLGEDEAGVPAHQPRDGRTDRGIVEGCLDAVAVEDLGTEPPGRPVHRVGDEHVVARADDSRDCHRHRGEPACGHHGAMPALDGRHRLGERAGVLRAGGAVGDVVVAVVAVEPADVAVEVLGEDRGRPVHRDVDGTLCANRGATERDELGVLFHGLSLRGCVQPETPRASRLPRACAAHANRSCGGAKPLGGARPARPWHAGACGLGASVVYLPNLRPVPCAPAADPPASIHDRERSLR